MRCSYLALQRAPARDDCHAHGFAKAAGILHLVVQVLDQALERKRYVMARSRIVVGCEQQIEGRVAARGDVRTGGARLHYPARSSELLLVEAERQIVCLHQKGRVAYAAFEELEHVAKRALVSRRVIAEGRTESGRAVQVAHVMQLHGRADIAIVEGVMHVWVDAQLDPVTVPPAALLEVAAHVGRTPIVQFGAEHQHRRDEVAGHGNAAVRVEGDGGFERTLEELLRSGTHDCGKHRVVGPAGDADA